MTLLATLSWPEVQALAEAGAVLLVPIGSTEQHGPHLPLSTDTDVAMALCDAAAHGRDDVVVAPAVPYGSSGEHAGFAGTVSIGREATQVLLVELGRSACATFGRVVFVSAHGGNADPVTRAVTTLRSEGRDVHAFFPVYEGDAHAGRSETSMQLHLRPWLVRSEHAAPGDTRSVQELMPELRRGGVLAVSPNGVLGDPSGASAPEGAALLGALAAQLTAELVAS